MYLLNVMIVLLIMASANDFHKILVVTHLPIKSHAILNNALVKLLLEAGHEVTQIAMIPFNYTHPKLRQIDVSYNNKYVQGKKLSKAKAFNVTVLAIGPPLLDKSLLHRFSIGPVGSGLQPASFNEMGSSRAKDKKGTEKGLELYAQISKKIFTATMQHEDVARLLRDTSKTFDLVIAEWMFNDLCIGIAALYDCPLIWYSAMECYWTILQRIEETTNIYSSSISISMAPYLTAKLMREAYLNSLDEDAFYKIFEPLMASRGKSLRPFVELMHHSSMVLIYSHELLEDTSVRPENFKPIAGYHINDKLKHLPKDLKSAMDNARHGVIYFSMGSHLKSEDIPYDIKKKLIDMFGELKQVVVWKLEMKFSITPNNLHIVKWVHQQSILSHPNCILFITQGGILSLTEAIHFGVPIIGIPVFGDQFTNVRKAVKKGFGKKVDLSKKFVEDIKEAINEMLRTPSYRKKVKELSSSYHNRPMSPTVEVIYWVNKAIRTGIQHHQHYTLDGHIYNILCTISVTTVVTIIIKIISLPYLSRFLYRNRKVPKKL